MSWMQDDSGEAQAPRRQMHPNNRQSECPWAQDTDTQQFRRGPPTRDIKSSGNPINHTGYEEAQQQRMMKKSSGRGAGQCPWAQDNDHSFAKPANAIGAGLSARSIPSQASPQKVGMPTQQYYAQPLEDDGDDYLDQMHPTEMARMQQMMMKQQYEEEQRQQNMSQRQPLAKANEGGCPWAQVYNQPLETESRAAFQGSKILKPREPAHAQTKGVRPIDENYNLLHDGQAGLARAGSMSERDAAKQQQRDAIVNQGLQANLDTRAAAQAIKDRMRSNTNVISWN